MDDGDQMNNPYLQFLAEEARWHREFTTKYINPLLSAMAEQVDKTWTELGQNLDKTEHPDVRPWFHDNSEPGEYTEDPEDGYPYDE